MLLGLDSSTDAVSVAVHDGRRVRAQRTGAGARRHAELLAPLVADVLSEAGVSGERLDGIVVGVGPGAYTGLRVGLVTAEALALAWSVPVRGACSLDAMAVQALDTQLDRTGDGLLVVTDARRREVFWARYDAGGRRVEGPGVCDAQAVPLSGLPAVGAGALARPELFAAALEPAGPGAGWLCSGLLDGRIAAVPVEPWYLRRPDVTLAKAAKPVLAPGRRRRA